MHRIFAFAQTSGVTRAQHQCFDYLAEISACLRLGADCPAYLKQPTLGTQPAATYNLDEVIENSLQRSPNEPMNR